MLRTSRALNKRVACQRVRNRRAARLSGMRALTDTAPDADGCPHGGRAAHHANARPHRCSARRACLHDTIGNGMGIARCMHLHSIRDTS
ncbi:hypothetical protein DF037_31550 [Burkholderia contaminans]|uniref:Uncharacterized protein n=1 Tax=Burkholderia contaminans TaxID=488447 RepID=A0A3N8QB68_9BURK|nr:hypothetical protein DF037_31550 [Burkholderia contaminans]TCW62903.1 hypothetical protein C5O79_36850 [Burkholderia sp. SRS-25]